MPKRYGVFASLALCFTLLALIPASAAAHEERPAQEPDGSGHVPSYRTGGPHLLVCKTDRAGFEQRIATFPSALKQYNLALWDECQRSGYRYLQQAVNSVTQAGITILVLPGIYLEEPSRQPPSGGCAALRAPVAKLGYQVLSWDQQLQCPNNQNLVAIFNKTDLQIEGTGAAPTDVVFDAADIKLNTIRADRSNGIYLRNLTAQHSTFNAIYIMETDGFVIDDAIGRWNAEYGFLTFADDHGLYAGCEAYGNGDSGIYPGAAHNINVDNGFNVSRYAIEVKGCYSHNNTLGYSGTAGDSVWAHDNRFVNNTAGVATDSAFPNHPGLPQNHARFERNEIGNNNVDYYVYVRDGTCSKPPAERNYEGGVVCPAIGVPPGTGVINPGGNYNLWRDNWVYGNQYAGFLLTWVPGIIRNDTSLAAQFDTSHHNRYLGNEMGVTPSGQAAPNRLDFWWDGQGNDNCWQGNTTAPTEPVALPQCGADGNTAGAGTTRMLAEPIKMLKLIVCNGYDLNSAYIPGNCDWFGAQGLERIEVQVAAVGAILLAALALLLWRRLLARARWAAVSALVGVAGAALGVFGTAYDGTRLTALGLVLLGCWWLTTGLALRKGGAGRLGWLTVALGGFALLGAVDTGLWMLPWIPASPAWLLLLLELVWVPWALVAVLRRPRAALAAQVAVAAI